MASGETAQIHGSISKIKMEIQKKIHVWTSIYEKKGVNCGFCAFMRINSIADPGFFVKGGPGPTARKQPGQGLFLVLNLFYS